MRLTTARRFGLALAAPSALALALAAGCSASDPQGANASSGAPTPSAGTSVAPPAATPTTGPLTFGPFGYGPVRLGQSLEEAKATGIVVSITPIAENCSHADMLGPDKKVITNRTRGDGMIYFVNSKIVSISAPADTPTPEGAMIYRTTRKELDALYPSKRKVPASSKPGEETSGYEVADIPGNPNAEYHFTAGEKADGILGGIEIVAKGTLPGC